MARRLGAAQRRALLDLVSVLPGPMASIRPGYEGRRWAGRNPLTGRLRTDTYDLSQIGPGLVRRGLIEMRGVPFGPKTYQVTPEGYAEARRLLPDG